MHIPPLVSSLACRWLVPACLVCYVSISSAAQARHTPSLFPKALVKTEDVEAAIRAEWELRKVYDALPGEGEAWFTTLQGTSKVLVSAPHATAQMREGKKKFADAGTGALAIMLNKLAKTPVIYTTRESPSDPNFYDDNAYKVKLKELLDSLKPKLVLDLHASHWYRPYDVDFGTLQGVSFAGHTNWFRQLATELRAAGLRDFSQDYFAATTNQTVTKFVHQNGIPCVQLEINETWLNLFSEKGAKIAGTDEPTNISEDILRIDQTGAHQFASLLEGLVRFVAVIDGQSRAANNNSEHKKASADDN